MEKSGNAMRCDSYAIFKNWKPTFQLSENSFDDHTLFLMQCIEFTLELSCWVSVDVLMTHGVNGYASSASITDVLKFLFKIS